MKQGNKTLRALYVILAVVLIALVLPFVLWIRMPKKALRVVVLNKTLPLVTSADGKITGLDYSKQRGLFWIMDYLGIINPSTNQAYDFTNDYYGNFLAAGKLVNKPLNELSSVPDIIYLSDTYGTGDPNENGVEAKGISGLTEDEVGLVASCYAHGTTVIGEYNIAGEPTPANVAQELGNIFGVGFTGWAGKFYSDLASQTDVPNWVRIIYKQKYGRKWGFSGAGVVIAGNNTVIILQRDKDFAGQSIDLCMTAGNAKTFNTGTVDYFNWFEIIKPADSKSVIAWYDLNLTAAGSAKMKLLGLNNRFPAIIAKSVGSEKSYYFAGDFCDYREPAKIANFLGAADLYRTFNLETEGDNAHFYWDFYVPLMSKLLQDVKPLGNQ